MDGQLGLEPDFKDYLKTMSKIMRELKRVLKKDGTCWINLGDTYSAKPVGKFNGGGKEFAGRNMDHVFGSGKVDKTGQGVMEKSRLGIPERFYIDCINDGWLARNFIPWYKSSSMPSSVKDRFTNKWEPVFFFAKSGRYYFNLDEVREKNIYQAKPPKTKHSDIEHSQGKLFDDVADTPELEMYAEQEKRKSVNIPKPSNRQTIDLKHSGIYDIETGESLNHPLGKNPGDFFKDIEYTDEELLEWIKLCRKNQKALDLAPPDIFFINTHPFPEAHFATFPVGLPKRILRCACPPDGIVLDPFFGSGTTGVAAEELGLKWIGIELNKEYIQIAKKRLEKYNNKRMGGFT